MIIYESFFDNSYLKESRISYNLVLYDFDIKLNIFHFNLTVFISNEI